MRLTNAIDKFSYEGRKWWREQGQEKKRGSQGAGLRRPEHPIQGESVIMLQKPG